MKNISIAAGMIFILSCGGNTDTKENKPGEPETDTAWLDTLEKMQQQKTAPADAEEVNRHAGYYVGMFVATIYGDENKSPSGYNKINISIDSVRRDEVFGHSVVAGNIRPFKGSVRITEQGLWQMRATEPGDDKYDGRFEFFLDKDGTTITGTWSANDKTLAVTGRSYKLTRRTFAYDTSLALTGTEGYMLKNVGNDEYEMTTEAAGAFNASAVELKKENVENMFAGDLEIMRNAIYARHGYSFKNRKMRYFFDYVDWYIPVSTDVRKQLTELEMKNIALIKRYEQHASRYYDRFGR